MTNPQAVTIQRYVEPSNRGEAIVARVSDTALLNESMALALTRIIAEKIAERYVEEHFAEVAALLDQNAIANLAIAEAGQRIAKVIHERQVVLQPEGAKTYVNKRRIF